MQDHSILRVKDPREVQNLVLLNNKQQMLNAQLSLLRRNLNTVLNTVIKKHLNKLLSQLLIQLQTLVTFMVLKHLRHKTQNLSD